MFSAVTIAKESAASSSRPSTGMCISLIRPCPNSWATTNSVFPVTNSTSCLFASGDSSFRRGTVSRALTASSIPEAIWAFCCASCAVAGGTLTMRASDTSAAKQAGHRSKNFRGKLMRVTRTSKWDCTPTARRMPRTKRHYAGGATIHTDRCASVTAICPSSNTGTPLLEYQRMSRRVASSQQPRVFLYADRGAYRIRRFRPLTLRARAREHRSM